MFFLAARAFLTVEGAGPPVTLWLATNWEVHDGNIMIPERLKVIPTLFSRFLNHLDCGILERLLRNHKILTRVRQLFCELIEREGCICAQAC